MHPLKPSLSNTPILYIFPPVAEVSTPILAPGEVGEGAVGVRHLMRVFTLFNSCALTVVGVHKLGGDAVFHAHAFAGSSCLDKPHGSQVVLALAFNLKRNLVVGATYAAGAGFDIRLDILESLFENVEGIVDFELASGFLHAAVNQALGNLLFTVKHDAVNKPLDRYAIV